LFSTCHAIYPIITGKNAWCKRNLIANVKDIYTLGQSKLPEDQERQKLADFRIYLVNQTDGNKFEHSCQPFGRM